MLTSRKLAGAIAGMLSIVGVVIGSAVVGAVPLEVQLTSVGLLAGLGGYQISRQARIDELADAAWPITNYMTREMTPEEEEAEIFNG
jgi:hypothetical protein